MYSDVRSSDPESSSHQSAGLTHAFKEEVQAFLSESLTEPLREAGRKTTGLKSDPAACKLWREALAQKGWVAPDWPTAHGGAGWSPEQRLYFETACAANDAPILMSSGVRTIGPLIIAHGNDEQKNHYLPAILNGQHEWCQGFSEPQAGSDLPALALRATRDGDEFILNGTKLWTSFAQAATHMFLLARSNPDSRGRDGLVFLLVEMRRPGIKVSPIKCLDGSHEVSEVFFDNVRTPVADRIGEIDEGWAVAGQLMQIARSNNTTTGTLRRAYRAVERQVSGPGQNELSLINTLVDLARQIDDFEALEERLSKASGRQASSMMKLRATELHQAITEVGLTAAPNSSLAMDKYLSTRGATIYSGTSEIHRNALARMIGCP
ncbi:acyl-CoA dehydrogenase family protein [Henriciella litoralis]|uniref:acyl-CoA dehydrogenase family protein n=1 Tax=Henriciella litoralis TaxID=568102 RepID=UPI000A0763FB|nr:acyl-CoA dehydrogenase family protein [Henriciella litoralis]